MSDAVIATDSERPKSGDRGSPRKAETLLRDKATSALQAAIKLTEHSSFNDVLPRYENSHSDSIRSVSVVPTPGEIKQEDRLLGEQNTRKPIPTETSALVTQQ